MANVVER